MVRLLHFVSRLLRLDKMYERHKRRYSLCDISKVDRTVDVVLLKVRGHASYIPELSGSFLSECSNWVRGHLRTRSMCEQWGVAGPAGDFKVLKGISNRRQWGLENQHLRHLQFKCHFTCFWIAVLRRTSYS